MEAATRDLPPTPFARPEGITDREICKLSGKLPTEFCVNRMTEHFIAGTEPTQKDDLFQQIRIDPRTGLLTPKECAINDAILKTFAIFPPDLRTWARENGWPEPPRTVSPRCSTETQNREGEWLMIQKPHDGDSFELDPLVPNESEKITLETEASQSISSVEWFVDGKSF